MTLAFFAVALIGFLLAANGRRPLPSFWLSIPTFFAGWLTVELAPQHLVLHVIVTIAFIAAGAVHGGLGIAAVVLSIATAALLVSIISVASRSRRVVAQALCEG